MTLKISFTNFVPALCWNDPTFHRIHRISNMDRTLMRVYLHEVLLTRREPSWRHECPGKAETSIFDGVLRLLHGHHHTDAKHWHDVFGSNGEYRCTLWYQSWNSGCSLSLYQTIGRITLMRRPLQLRWRPGTKAPFQYKECITGHRNKSVERVSYLYHGSSYTFHVDAKIAACLVANERNDDVIMWEHFPRWWPFVRRIHRSAVNSPHKWPVTRTLDIFLC